ncbi:hypothetical protein GCM10018962_90140 [Dactylosporangium matsuzakiense]|uniref:Uncharacterized protein n=1 Tax=Dactylosporangium matsuzakiense TaxID=53360 RepID=A0A9W6KKU3_9ACTN|nr:hypothetical protein GCM10017581_030550 [Dactylosporangium matsuzakiense]
MVRVAASLGDEGRLAVPVPVPVPGFGGAVRPAIGRPFAGAGIVRGCGWRRSLPRRERSEL